MPFFRWIGISTLIVGSFATTAPADNSPYLTRDGTRLEINGRQYRAVGANSYSMATDWGENLGCGGPVDADALFGALPARALVRLWAWQGSMATDPTTPSRNWGPLDRVVAAAERHDAFLIMSLTSQGGECDDGRWKDRAWYDGGYRNHYDEHDYAITSTSYWDYVREIVSRYKDSPAVAMWEPVNEPEASDCAPGYSAWNCWGHLTCDHTRAATAMRRFFDVIGGEIKRIDPNHLVESGVLGGGQCGTAGEDYSFVHASPGIDVASVHDYGSPDDPMPGDQWNGLAVRLEQMRTLQKPLIVGEAGINAVDSGTGCDTPGDRADKYRRKLDAMFANGVSAFLPWNAAEGKLDQCTYHLSLDDPTLSMFRRYRIR